MPFTNFPGGITSFGMPVTGGPTTFGTAYFVDYRSGSDGNNGKSTTQAFKTLSKAYATVTSNANDIIFIDGDSTVVETAMITWSKNRVHVIGCNGVPGHYGAGAKVEVGVTTAATDIGTLKVTGVRNTFSNIKFMNANTKDEALYCLVDAGEYTRYFNCEFYKSTDLDETSATEVLAEGDSSMFYNCTIGSLVNAISGAINRPCILFDRGIISGKVARDNMFEGCLLWRKAGNAGNLFIEAPAADDAERMILFKDCTLINNILGTTMTVGVESALTNAYMIFKNCTSIGCTTLAGDTSNDGVYVDGAVPDPNTTAVSVQATAS